MNATVQSNHAASSNGKALKSRGRGATSRGGSTRKGSGVDCGTSLLRIENSAPQTTPDPGASKARRAWTPDAQDHQAYHWVRFEGKTQAWVAYQLGINQATVSRIALRYERWQAHADPREGGRLDPAERLRAQRWLTYERNELILASALRIANEMEGFADVSKSVISRPLSQPSAEREMRTETAVIDRHGVAARFLRLAFRINMEQLRLVEQDAPPMPQPLSAEQIDEEERATAEIADELRAARQRSDEQIAEIERRRREDEAAAQELARQEIAERAQIAGTKPGPGEAATEGESAVLREQVCSRLGDGDMHEVHRMHTAEAAETDASSQPACSCAADSPAEENVSETCMSESARPSHTNPTRKRGSPRAGALRTASPGEHVPVARRDRLRPVVQS